MALKLYNTLTRKKEEFIPLNPPQVKMYVCGVTVYDYSHVGHARANVVFDIVARYLKFKGYQLSFVRNFTDIDDKIINRANELKIPCEELTEKFMEAFHADIQSLGNEPVNLEPKATEHIPEMVQIIEKLIQKGMAYEKKGDVFYQVRNFKDYGKLSGKNIEDLESGARVEVNEEKLDPLDFALWKSAKPKEPSWDSPWGKGRPGWHIECSAMSMKYLGESFDIHGGGRDLIFPHHENEIAQSEGASGKPFVKYWLHNGFVNINTEKMSKSLGNFFTIREVLSKFDWEVVRAFLLSLHYRSPIDFSDQNLQETGQALERFYLTVKRAQDFIKGNPPSPSAAPLEGESRDEGASILTLLQDFEAAMDDDFNTAKVLGALFEAVRVLNKILDQHSKLKSQACAFVCDSFLKSCEKIYLVLGCYGTQAAEFFERIQKKVISQIGIDEAKILALIAERKEARKNKNFKRSDEIRDELLAMNIILKDKPDGSTEWSAKS